MFTASQNVIPLHLMDGKLHDFKGIKTTGMANPDGDKTFDSEDLPKPQATL
jgi:tRNA 2-thiocytidine biosynthesis protein TtcA